MCRSIKTLRRSETATTTGEIDAAALQFVRKVSGATRPSKANLLAFERARDEIAATTIRLLDELVAQGPPRNREEEAEKGRLRWQQRLARQTP